jgi:hypothetical protein
MKKALFAFAISVVSSVAMMGCMTAAEETAAATESAELSAIPRPPPDSICFTCSVDPSVRACSSDPEHAAHVCQRACWDCTFGPCVRGICEPEL